jgi:hypothetical protein
LFIMPDYSLVPVDYQPEFEGVSLVPVDHDPFSTDGVTQQAQTQQAQTQQGQPQQPATGAGQPDDGAPVIDGGPSGSQGAWPEHAVLAQVYRVRSPRPQFAHAPQLLPALPFWK